MGKHIKENDCTVHKLKYRTDPEYRARELKRAAEHHQRNKVSKNYRDLTAQRKKIYWTQQSIEFHRGKIHQLQQRLRYQIHRKEELELLWGKERAERKRNQRSVAEPRKVENPRSPEVEINPNTCSLES